MCAYNALPIFEETVYLTVIFLLTKQLEYKYWVDKSQWGVIFL